MADNTLLNAGSGGDTIATNDIAGVKYQVVKQAWGAAGTANQVAAASPLPIRIYDSTGASPDVLAYGGGNSLEVAAAGVDFIPSTGNSTTSQLTAGSTFTGTIETVFNQPDISILLTTDQNGTLTLNQYIDAGGTRRISSWVFTIAASVPFSRCFVANGNYFNLTFQNTGGASTTTLNINTAYGTLDTATNLGNIPVSLNEVNGTAFALGQGTMAASLPVAIASNQSALATSPTQATASALQMTATQALGTAGTRWFAQLSDGTNSPTIKAASTAAVATDPSMVVSVSPNNSVAVTQATPASLQVTATQAVGTAATRWFAQISDGTNSPAVKAASTAAAFTDPALTVDPRPGGAMVTASAAMADAFANPTLGKQAVVNMVYNGTTWDLQRGMSTNNTTGDTGAKTATGNGATITNVGNKGVSVVVNMGAVTGTTPTCVLKMQGSADGGTTWYDIPGATTASLTATGVYAITVYPGAPTVAGTTTSITGTASCGQPLPRTWRMVWTIGGTTPSFTITNIQYNYIPN
jgi:hypothetical protein